MITSALITSTLQRLSKITASNIPAEKRLLEIMEVVRHALQSELITVALSDIQKEGISFWHSYPDHIDIDKDNIEKIASDFLFVIDDIAYKDSIIALPLNPSNEIKGVLLVNTPLQIEKDTLETFAGYISISAENLHIKNQLSLNIEKSNQGIEEIAAIYEIEQALDSTDLKPLLNLIVAKAAAVMDAQVCSLMLKNPTDGSLTIEANFGLTDDIVNGTKINYGEGIAGKVAASGRPMLIFDVAADPRFKGQVMPRDGVSGSICVPIKNEQNIVEGVISIRRHHPKPPFAQDDLKLFSVFATHASLAMRNARLYSNLKQKVQEMSTINNVLSAINSTLDLESVLEQIVECITETVGFDRCCLYLLDSRTNEFKPGARRGFDNNSIQDSIPYGEGVIGIAAKEKASIHSQDSPAEFGENNLCNYLATPIVVRDQCIGVVDNCISGKSIEKQSVDLLSTYISQAGIAIENARLYEAMEQKYSEMNVIYENSRNISSAYGVQNIARMLINTSLKAVDSDGAFLLLLGSDSKKVELHSSDCIEDTCILNIEELLEKYDGIGLINSYKFPQLIDKDHPARSIGPYAKLLNSLASNNDYMIVAPLVSESTTIGMLILSKNSHQDYTGAELKLISILTSHAATVLKNAIIYEQKMTQRALELTALYDFSMNLSQAANLEEALNSILDIVANLVVCDESFIYAIDHENKTACIKAGKLKNKCIEIPNEISLYEQSIVSWAIDEKKAIVSPDITKDDRFKNLGSGNVKSLMAIPLIVQTEIVGVMIVQSYNANQYTDDDVRVLSIIASQGAAIYKELEALSTLSSYTGNILSSIAAGVVALDSKGYILAWNDSSEAITKIPRKLVENRHYSKVLSRLKISDEDKKTLQEAIDNVYKTGEPYVGYKMKIDIKNDDFFYINMTISQLKNNAGEQLGVVIIFENITNEMKMEEQMHRMSELAAIGQLAAGIAHELRNPLSSIKGAAQFLQNEYEEEESISEFLSIIIDEVNGLNKLTTEFLDFARPIQLELEAINIDELLSKTLQLMSMHIIDNRIDIERITDDNTPIIEADEGKIQQVLKNIIINAIQAMPDGGTITFTTGPAPNGGVFISIKDTGIGIPKDKQEKIFQPFITTKTKGTGLGLSIVQKILENHGGKIEVNSEEGVGTEFIITLPAKGNITPPTAEIDQTWDRRVSGKIGKLEA
ncbi:MAG: GAF domain-containing protein [Armatimonadota bacterium]